MASIADPVTVAEDPVPPLDLSTAIDRLPVTKREKGEIKKWITDSRRKRIEILITGRTGVGKSTLVNSLVGRPVAEAGNMRAVTKVVTDYQVTTEEGVEVVVWDSPGLQDSSGNEEEYLAELKAKCSDVDVVIFCIKLATTRSELKVAQKELRAINKLTTTFGPKLWKHAIFVLTFANTLEAMLKVKPDCERLFNDKLQEWEGRIQGALIEAGVPKKIAEKVPVQPAGHPRKPHLPGREYWLSKLWLVFLKCAKQHSKPGITLLNLHRLKRASDVNEKDFSKKGYEQPIVVDKNDMALAGLVSGIGVALNGVAIGAGIGATVGAAGAGVGAVVGLVVGGGVGLAAGLLLHHWQTREKHSR